MLHLIGDLHQPLHASDDSDLGGNRKTVSAPAVPSGSRHHYWDTVMVEQLGNRPEAIARLLARQLARAGVHLAKVLNEALK